jgi:shikimate kinase
MNIVLIGFRCSGKSTIGRELAEALSTEFVDTDDYLETKRGRSIGQIFEDHGETVFRLWESDCLNEISKMDNVIIATGGGAVLKYKNVRNLKRCGRIIFLDVNPDVVVHRIRKDVENRSRRPALTGADLEEEIVDQIKLRRPYYLSVADWSIDTSFMNIESATQEILDQIHRWGFGSDTGTGEDAY